MQRLDAMRLRTPTRPGGRRRSQLSLDEEHQHQSEPSVEANTEDEHVEPATEEARGWVHDGNDVSRNGEAVLELDGNTPVDASENPNAVVVALEDGNIDNKVEVEATGDEDDGRPKGGKLFLIVIACVMCEFIVGVDQTIVAAATASVANDLHSLTSVGWFGSAYLLTSASLQPTFGRLYRFFHTKWLFTFALLVFQIASIVSAVAKTAPVFIFGRALQGVGYAGIFIGVLVIGSASLPMHLQAIYSSAISSAYGLGASLGPLMGGALATKVNWRWCFWINLPPGVAAMAIVALFCNPPQEKQTLRVLQRLRQIDWFGPVALLVSSMCILMALEDGGIKSSWGSAKIIALLVVSGVLAVSFFVLQAWLKEGASVLVRLVKQRNMALLVVYNVVVGATYYSILYSVPLYFQAVHGSSALASGVQMLGTIIPVVIAGIVAGLTISHFMTFYREMIFYASMIAIGSGILTLLEVNSSKAKYIGFQIIVGTGIGGSYMLAYVASQALAAVKDRGSAAVLVVFVQLMGGTIWVSVSQAIYQNRLLDGIKKIPGLDVSLVIDSGVSEFRRVVPKELLPEVVKVALHALKQVFLACAVLGAVGTVAAIGLDRKRIEKNH